MTEHKCPDGRRDGIARCRHESARCRDEPQALYGDGPVGADRSGAPRPRVDHGRDGNGSSSRSSDEGRRRVFPAAVRSAACYDQDIGVGEELRSR